MGSKAGVFKCTKEHALKCARFVNKRFPRKMHVYGDVAQREDGLTLDLVIEVLPEEYKLFRQQCRDHGLHWMTDERTEPDHSYWKTNPPRMLRTNIALMVLGFDDKKKSIREEWDALTMALAIGLPADIIDVICVPVGWLQHLEIRKRMLKGTTKGHEDSVEKIAEQVEELIIT